MDTPHLLTVTGIRTHSGLGRNLAHQLAYLLPHIRVGRAGRGDRLLVRRADLERLLERAAHEQRDLLELARTFSPEQMRLWLQEEC